MATQPPYVRPGWQVSHPTVRVREGPSYPAPTPAFCADPTEPTGPTALDRRTAAGRPLDSWPLGPSLYVSLYCLFWAISFSRKYIYVKLALIQEQLQLILFYEFDEFSRDITLAHQGIEPWSFFFILNIFFLV